MAPQKPDVAVAQALVGGFQDVVACRRAAVEYRGVVAGTGFHAVAGCHGVVAGTGSAGTELGSLHHMEVGRYGNEGALEVGHYEREPTDRSESEVADLDRFENEAVGLEIGEEHFDTGVEKSADQEAGIAGAERTIEYWDSGAFLVGRLVGAAAGQEAVVSVLEIDAVVAGMEMAEDRGAGHMIDYVRRMRSCQADQRRAPAAGDSSESRLQAKAM